MNLHLECPFLGDDGDEGGGGGRMGGFVARCAAGVCGWL